MKMSKRKIELGEIQGAELDILLKLIRYFEENNIAYCTSGGTTLGSIRHKGFIPWDDDIDIFIPRKDYDRLLEISKDKLIDGYISILRPGQKNYACPYSKASNVKTVINEVNVKNDKYRTGLFVDIFPIDNFYDSALRNKIRNFRVFWLTSMFNTALGNKNLSKKFSPRWWFKQILYIAQFLPAKLITAERITFRIDNMGRKTKNLDSRYVGCLVFYAPYETTVYDRADFDEFIDGEFEGHIIKNPVGYDNYLTALYGDYMTLPPEDEQIMHGFDAWYID